MAVTYVNRDALYAKLKAFVDAMTPQLKTAFQTGDQSKIDEEVNKWFTSAERDMLQEDADHFFPEGTLHYWIW